MLRKPSYQYQILLGEISGGIEDGKALACRRKQWVDKLKLMVMMRDELNQFIKEYKTAKSQDLIKLLVYGVQVFGARINIYSMIWCGGGVYLFGLIDTCILPMSSESIYNLEQAFAILQTLKSKCYLASSFIMEIERFISKQRRLSMPNNIAVEEAIVCVQQKLSITESSGQS
ncbi:hypothetical protein F8M41_005591 [Gigaspora margarita]|uniref:Uncharacterized protein n=1 Tax=Gigaspora margarita TaxID=4874 RepID=A0A8H4AX38_GIGMA|nr:hypothetical protein F8M41_005591 [Gigaspora margarita]